LLLIALYLPLLPTSTTPNMIFSCLPHFPLAPLVEFPPGRLLLISCKPHPDK
jgi:hypothetical protein